eukprot:scaffold6042_cov247-Ochromonas_danica.AAC.19
MGCLIVILIVLMSLSAWTTQSSGGNFSKITFPNNHTYSNWYNDVCEEYPYAYLTPFTFTYSSSTESSSKETYCPWPLANSILRLAGTCMAMVTLAVQSAGLGFCNKAFANTVLNQDMSSLNMTITCSSDGETAIVVFDVVASVIFFILHSAWGLTADIYLEKKDDSKYLLKKKAKSKK